MDYLLAQIRAMLSPLVLSDVGDEKVAKPFLVNSYVTVSDFQKNQIIFDIDVVADDSITVQQTARSVISKLSNQRYKDSNLSFYIDDTPTMQSIPSQNVGEYIMKVQFELQAWFD